MDSYGFLWIPMAMDSYMEAMDQNGFLWIPMAMDSYGILWLWIRMEAMDQNGFLWIPMAMESYGFLWIPMEGFHKRVSCHKDYPVQGTAWVS
jgi:hypothetical protein